MLLSSRPPSGINVFVGPVAESIAAVDDLPEYLRARHLRKVAIDEKERGFDSSFVSVVFAGCLIV